MEHNIYHDGNDTNMLSHPHLFKTCAKIKLIYFLLHECSCVHDFLYVL